jgi:acyl-[acyl-carrier-protein]-phospholipid O-acyltransferase/long-chain-fatty-acid--[acyl-carrier-protein] ligase
MPLWPQQDQPAIITPNHASYLDGPLLALLTPRPLLFGVDPDFSTQEPWRSLLLRIGRIRGCEMVTMTPGRGQGLRQMLRTLHRGGWVCLFPEGGIGTDQEYPGARWLAERTGARIHPLEIHAFGVGKMKMPYTIVSTQAKRLGQGR